MIERDDLVAQDRADPLAGFGDRCLLPDRVIYLDGNSLGPLSWATPARVGSVVSHQWSQSLVRACSAHDATAGLRRHTKLWHEIAAPACAPQ